MCGHRFTNREQPAPVSRPACRFVRGRRPMREDAAAEAMHEHVAATPQTVAGLASCLAQQIGVEHFETSHRISCLSSSPASRRCALGWSCGHTPPDLPLGRPAEAFVEAGHGRMAQVATEQPRENVAAFFERFFPAPACTPVKYALSKGKLRPIDVACE